MDEKEKAAEQANNKIHQENKMGEVYNGFGLGDAVVNAAMSGGFNNGNRGGNWNDGSVGNIGAPYAGLTSIQHAIGCTTQKVEDQNDFTREVIGHQISSSQQAFENASRQAQFNELKDVSFQAELRTADRLAAMQKDINDNAKDQAACCCAAQLQAAKDKGEILTKMEAIAKESVAHDRDKAERELLAIKYSHHGGRSS